MERIPQVSAKERTHTGATIRELRHARYPTLEEAARSIGVSASYLFRLERNKGDRSLKTLAAIASFFNVPLAVMFSERGSCDFSPAAPVAKRW